MYVGGFLFNTPTQSTEWKKAQNGSETTTERISKPETGTAGRASGGAPETSVEDFALFASLQKGFTRKKHAPLAPSVLKYVLAARAER